jgi:hypothetical protein
MAAALAQSLLQVFATKGNIGLMISLVDPFGAESPAPNKSSKPASAEDIEFWTDVFRAILPEDEPES